MNQIKWHLITEMPEETAEIVLYDGRDDDNAFYIGTFLKRYDSVIINGIQEGKFWNWEDISFICQAWCYTEDLIPPKELWIV